MDRALTSLTPGGPFKAGCPDHCPANGSVRTILAYPLWGRLERRGGHCHKAPRRGLFPFKAPRLGPADLDYPLHDRDVRVTACGPICLNRKKINISTILAGQRVGIDERIWLVTSINDLKQKILQPNDNPLGPRVSSPMSWVRSVTHLSGPDTQRLAPRVGFEPTTSRLTAGCSTAELPRNKP